MLGYENGKYDFEIPVSWEVYDTIQVRADSLKEAYDWAVNNEPQISLGTEPEYIDGSYKIGEYDLAKAMNGEGV